MAEKLGMLKKYKKNCQHEKYTLYGFLCIKIIYIL